MTVPPPVSKDVYFLNAADNPGGSYCEKEATYLVKYNASFKVMGGGTMTVHDSRLQLQGTAELRLDRELDSAMRPAQLSDFGRPVPAAACHIHAAAAGRFRPRAYYPQRLWITAKSVTASPLNTQPVAGWVSGGSPTRTSTTAGRTHFDVTATAGAWRLLADFGLLSS